MRPLLFGLILSLLSAASGRAHAWTAQPPATYTTDKDISYYEETTLKTSAASAGASAAAIDYQRAQCKLDLLRPTNRPGFATVVWFHSGGLVAGQRGFPRLQGQEIALVAAGYRLSPQGKFPDFLEDAAAATAWVLRHIADYGGDPQKVFAGGASAGGYLAAMVGMDPRWLAAHDLSNRQLAGLLPVTGQMTTHFTVKKLRDDTGPDLRPLIDEYSPIYYAAEVTRNDVARASSPWTAKPPDRR
ncbi:MAG: alpha/beta hydrolase [Opitutaceae bacterium]|jgi:acetyl esterase/lipase|nr:alpha/beta hydrolase [Opitutaceae bacterium]